MDYKVKRKIYLSCRVLSQIPKNAARRYRKSTSQLFKAVVFFFCYFLQPFNDSFLDIWIDSNMGKFTVP